MNKFNFDTSFIRALLMIALSTAFIAGCSGDSNTAIYPNSNVHSMSGNTIGAALEDQATTDNRGSAGEGMSTLYQTGYHVDTITITRAGTTPRIISFVTDTSNNVIQEQGGPNNYDDFWYDEFGRVSSFGSLGVAVGYNEDGAIKSTALRSLDNASITINDYTYSDGKIRAVASHRVSGGIQSMLGGAAYHYHSDGTLNGSRLLTSETNELSDLGYDFTLNANGLVSSAQKVLVGAFDKQFNSEYLYFTFDYDKDNNLVKVENYSHEGELIKTVDLSYLPNTEPTPNIAGFMLITQMHFKQVFETY